MGDDDPDMTIRAMRVDPRHVEAIEDRAPPSDYWVDDEDAQQSRWLEAGELSTSYVDNNITGWRLQLDPFAHASDLDNGELTLNYSHGASVQIRFGDIDIDGSTPVDHYRRKDTVLRAVGSNGRDIYDANATPTIVAMRREMIEAVVDAGVDRVKWSALTATFMAGKGGGFDLAMSARQYLEEHGAN